MPPAPSRAAVVRLMNATASAGCRGCGRSHTAAHSCATGHTHAPKRGMATPVDLPGPGNPDTDYAFEMAASTLRFGTGVTQEVGMDVSNMLARLSPAERAKARIAVFTDPNISKLPVMETVAASLKKEGHDYAVFDKVSVEPTEASWIEAINWTRNNNITHFLAVGGGSTMDTAKAANLLSCYPDHDMYDFINAPVGKGTPIDKQLKPIIAVPTTAGTGSETTGTAILDIPSKRFKTGIASRALKPTLGIVDTLNTATCPREVAVAAGLDVLFHSLESYTAIPYWARGPRPDNPIKRPAYQGSNPVSDIFSKWALEQTVKYLPRIFRDPHGDEEARAQMLLASSTAGIGFGNAGVHLCHAGSYPISSLNKARTKDKQYFHPSYSPDIPLIPHGVAVSLTAPAVFKFTAPSDPERHRTAAAIFMGKERAAELDKISDADIGSVLHDEIQKFLDGLAIPRGLTQVGYTSSDIETLAKGMLPQRRVLDLAPLLAGKDNQAEELDQLAHILEGSMKW